MYKFKTCIYIWLRQNQQKNSVKHLLAVLCYQILVPNQISGMNHSWCNVHLSRAIMWYPGALNFSVWNQTSALVPGEQLWYHELSSWMRFKGLRTRNENQGKEILGVPERSPSLWSVWSGGEKPGGVQAFSFLWNNRILRSCAASGVMKIPENLLPLLGGFTDGEILHLLRTLTSLLDHYQPDCNSGGEKVVSMCVGGWCGREPGSTHRHIQLRSVVLMTQLGEGSVPLY